MEKMKSFLTLKFRLAKKAKATQSLKRTKQNICRSYEKYGVTGNASCVTEVVKFKLPC